MNKNNKKILPKNFFSKIRMIVSSEEALKDVIPPKYVTKKEKNIVKLTNKNS